MRVRMEFLFSNKEREAARLASQLPEAARFISGLKREVFEPMFKYGYSPLTDHLLTPEEQKLVEAIWKRVEDWYNSCFKQGL